jgi:FlaA1/EpsC-like NDP-sugar epimerase
MVLGDAVLIFAAYFLSYYLRFDGQIPQGALINFMQTIIWIVPLKLVCLGFFNLYKGMWRYTSIDTLGNLIKACVTSSGIIIVLLLFTVRFVGFPRSVFFIDLFLTFLFIGSSRVVVRLWYSHTLIPPKFSFWRNKDAKIKRLLLIGAGDGAEKLLREIMDNPNVNYNVIGFLDDDSSKFKKSIHGVSILGTIDELGKIAQTNNVDEIIIAIPSASAYEMRRIVHLCEDTGLPYKTIPGIGELVEGKISVNTIREVRYEDLLGRKQVNLNMEQIGVYLTGKTVMVTGGAGSIGSELCRQILPFRPESLIIVEINESGLYEIALDLSANYPKIQIESVLGSVQNKYFMQRIFERYKPNVVFHAAAYKHVPMMEIHPWEAVFNNVVGTQTTLNCCCENGVDRCVVVSTDKAVRPTNVMGATKRMDEIMAQVYAKENGCRFMSVRFGNVIGSVGSVIPLFQKQIERGGPLTLTHPDVTRYFMTIPEACRLILQAGAIGNGEEIFILNMGVPIRIADMARDIIRLSGYKPDEEIEIKYIGLRPGEKLFEELITEGEGIQETEHEHIMVLKGLKTEVRSRRTEDGGQMTMKEMNEHIERLVELAMAYDEKGIKEELKRIVPEYMPQFDGKEDGGERTEVRGQMTDDRGRATEGRGERSEVRRQRADDGRHKIQEIGDRIEERGDRIEEIGKWIEKREESKAEISIQESEIRGKRTDDRGQR